MGIVSKTGDWAFKAFTAGLGLTTIYLAGTFSVNVYRGLAWHNSQSVSLSLSPPSFDKTFVYALWNIPFWFSLCILEFRGDWSLLLNFILGQVISLLLAIEDVCVWGGGDIFSN